MKKLNQKIKEYILSRYGWDIYIHPELHLVRRPFIVEKTRSNFVTHGERRFSSFEDAWNYQFQNSFAKWFFLSPDKMLPLIFSFGIDIAILRFREEFSELPLLLALFVLAIVNAGVIIIPINSILQWKRLQK